ncbi:unconventional myosin-IXb-like [Ascaphus truei]
MPEKENPGESLESKEKLTEHKLQRNPSKISEASTIQSPCDLAGGRKNLGNHHFGVHVGDLISETSSVPVVMEMLLEYLEMYGLHTEGIYRKCGAANRMRELKQSLENDPSSVKLDNYPIHVITGILKQWLRELPEPLMTFARTTSSYEPWSSLGSRNSCVPSTKFWDSFPRPITTLWRG